MKKYLILAVVIFAVILTAGTVYAASLTQAQINAIVGLLQSFGAAQSVINNVQVSLSGGTPSVPTASTMPTITPVSECRQLSSGMWVGLSDRDAGNEVSQLQKFLRAQGDFTYSEITGFYGPATEEAVRRFQSRSNIVSSGNAETTGYGVVGPSTRAKIAEVSCGNVPSLPTPTPTPIPTPIPVPAQCRVDNDCKEISCPATGGVVHEQCVSGKCVLSDAVKNKCSGTTQPSITVLSPNGGESWIKGTTQTIKWQDNRPMLTCGPTVSTSGASPTCVPQESRSYNIRLAPYYPPCTGAICSMVAIHMPYPIVKGVSGSSYNWGVGNLMDLYDALAPDGSYTVQICQTGTETCDSSDSYFKIYSAGFNLPPVIDGVTGPTVLKISETGTWTIKAHDPENGALSYLVNWGDNVTSGSASTNVPTPSAVSQTTTFTHSYSAVGTYTVKFTVTDSSGLSAQSSISVQVNNVPQPSTTSL